MCNFYSFLSGRKMRLYHYGQPTVYIVYIYFRNLILETYIHICGKHFFYLKVLNGIVGIHFPQFNFQYGEFSSGDHVSWVGFCCGVLAAFTFLTDDRTPIGSAGHLSGAWFGFPRVCLWILQGKYILKRSRQKNAYSSGCIKQST